MPRTQNNLRRMREENRTEGVGAFIFTSGHYFEPVAIVDGEAGLVAAKVARRIGIRVMEVAQVLDPRHLRSRFQLILQHCTAKFLLQNKCSTSLRPPTTTNFFAAAAAAPGRSENVNKVVVSHFARQPIRKKKRNRWRGLMHFGAGQNRKKRVVHQDRAKSSRHVRYRTTTTTTITSSLVSILRAQRCCANGPAHDEEVCHHQKKRRETDKPAEQKPGRNFLISLPG